MTRDVETSQAATAARGRHRSSVESRERLLTVAAELFAEHGYEATTVREIGRRADLDPTLIARYFGSKAALYLESLRRDGSAADGPPVDLTDPARVTELLERVRRNGLTPTLYSAIRPHDDAELQAAATDMLIHRVVDPAVTRANASGHEDAELRAELMTAALAGIVVSRAAGALPRLSDARSADVARLVAELVRALTGSR